MVNEEILNYLKENKDKFPLEDLKNELKKGGWSEEEITEAIAELEKAPATTPETGRPTESIEPVQSTEPAEISEVAQPAKPSVQSEKFEELKELVSQEVPEQVEKPTKVVSTESEVVTPKRAETAQEIQVPTKQPVSTVETEKLANSKGFLQKIKNFLGFK